MADARGYYQNLGGDLVIITSETEKNLFCSK